MRFIDRVDNIYGLYKTESWSFSKKYVLTELFKKENPNVYNLTKGDIKQGKIEEGAIYYIKYNNGGIALHKLVLVIEISKTPNKNGKFLIWCININAMKLDSRSAFFTQFFNQQIEKNVEKDSVNEEPPFEMKKNTLYNYLKSQGYNYIIEPLNIYDIQQMKRISTNVLEYFLFYISSEDNYNLLEQVAAKLDETGQRGDLKREIEKMLEKYKELLDNYEDNSKEFHKKLKNFESNLKLFDR